MSPDEYAAHRAERDREAARDAISAGCATPDEWALGTGQVDVLRGDIDADPFSAEDYALLASWLGGQR